MTFVKTNFTVSDKPIKNIYGFTSFWPQDGAIGTRILKCAYQGEQILSGKCSAKRMQSIVTVLWWIIDDFYPGPVAP